ncbi:MAG: nucleotide sugar dehydrogenase [Phycisphaeraceae bacterium]|nr:nucleotide sugar dehydrogenase [Phycisphaeraceae bacterium]
MSPATAKRTLKSSPSATPTTPKAARLSGPAAELMKKLESRTAVIGVVGLGYVGLPLIRAIRDGGFPVIGYDIDQRKIDDLEAGRAYIQHLGPTFFKDLSKDRKFRATANPALLEEADAILLCVPTPLGRHREPDLSFVLNSTEMVSKVLRRGQLVVLESTTYPGTTRDEMLPILEASERGRNLVHGRDYFLAFSPEREDPGSVGRTAAVIPKLVGGLDDVATDLAMALYSRVVKTAHRVSSAEIAESAKLLENIFRAVNIALVNEMKVVLAEMGIDVWEVISAASTKPFGFMPFYPGPGLGGHCIPLDPFYLSWKAREVGRNTRFIELAGEVNSAMPHYVIERVQHALNEDGKSLSNSKILVLGIAYKKNIDDIRESPAAEIIELLRDRGATVNYHDPHMAVFPSMRKHRIDLKSKPLTAATLKAHDCALIITDHDAVDYGLVGKASKLIVDTRNAMLRVPARQMRARLVKA